MEEVTARAPPPLTSHTDHTLGQEELANPCLLDMIHLGCQGVLFPKRCLPAVSDTENHGGKGMTRLQHPEGVQEAQVMFQVQQHPRCLLSQSLTGQGGSEGVMRSPDKEGSSMEDAKWKGSASLQPDHTRGQKSPPCKGKHAPNTWSCFTWPCQFRPGTVALREICRYQRITEHLICKLPFQRLVWEITQGFRLDLHDSKKLLWVLCRRSAEAYLVGITWGHKIYVSFTAKRVMILPQDMQLAQRIHGNKPQWVNHTWVPCSSSGSSDRSCLVWMIVIDWHFHVCVYYQSLWCEVLYHY